MKKKNVLSIFGTRPEAIKMAPVIQAMRRRADFISRVCVTGQHRQMLDQALALFEITPDFDLNVMSPDQSLSGLTCRIVSELDPVLAETRPDLVLVHGDTSTSFAAALTAFYHRIPVAHVEAGLRSGDMNAPWPEEANRKLTGVLAQIHFAPTQRAKENLLGEGVPAERIRVTGNTVIDALLTIDQRIQRDTGLAAALGNRFPWLLRSEKEGKRLLLVTGHRRESFGRGFEAICIALRELSKRDDIDIIYPVHLNPNVREPVQRILSDCKNIRLLEPQDYLPFVFLMTKAHVILTDSGGIQEEAVSLRKPVLVMRDITERPEGVEAGLVSLVGNRTETIVDAVNKLYDHDLAYTGMRNQANPYGDGKASQRIADFLSDMP